MAPADPEMDESDDDLEPGAATASTTAAADVELPAQDEELNEEAADSDADQADASQSDDDISSDEEPAASEKSDGKTRRRGGSRRRERVNSKKAAAAVAESTTSSEYDETPAEGSLHSEEPLHSTASPEVVISQRQPSQLKNTVRSLAGRDESAGSGFSLASRKIPDVRPDHLDDGEKKPALQARQIDSLPQPADVITGSTDAESSSEALPEQSVQAQSVEEQSVQAHSVEKVSE